MNKQYHAKQTFLAELISTCVHCTIDRIKIIVGIDDGGHILFKCERITENIVIKRTSQPIQIVARTVSAVVVIYVIADGVRWQIIAARDCGGAIGCVVGDRQIIRWHIRTTTVVIQSNRVTWKTGCKRK